MDYASIMAVSIPAIRILMRDRKGVNAPHGTGMRKR
jgi:hypothetical protein